MDHTILEVQEESEAPALRGVGGFRVELGEGVGEVGAGGGDALYSEGMLGSERLGRGFGEGV